MWIHQTFLSDPFSLINSSLDSQCNAVLNRTFPCQCGPFHAEGSALILHNEPIWYGGQWESCERLWNKKLPIQQPELLNDHRGNRICTKNTWHKDNRKPSLPVWENKAIMGRTVTNGPIWVTIWKIIDVRHHQNKRLPPVRPHEWPSVQADLETPNVSTWWTDVNLI